MKVIVNKDNEEKTSEFPKLVHFAHSGLICLMVNKTEGTVIKSPTGIYPVGSFERGFITDYADFEGTITLSND